MSPDLVSLETSIRLVLESVSAGQSEVVPLREAAHRILSEDLRAPFPLPPESASLMDGYAVRSAEVAAGATLRIGLVIPAGRAPARGLRSGECARILTGGVLPDGADAVVKQEEVDASADEVRFRAAVSPGDHVRAAGSDAAEGESLLPAGTELDAGALSLAASVGLDRLSVGRRPVVAILATGDELRRPGEPRAPGTIYESNSVGLAEQVREAGGEPVVPDLVADDPEAIVGRLKEQPADILVTSGGASVGDHDFSREVLKRLGGRRIFWQVAIRPGRPILFGTVPRAGLPDALFFALPGNPGASALTFDLLVRPAMRKMLGARAIRRHRVQARLTEAVKKPKGLVQLARGRCQVREQSLFFQPAPLQGSMSIRSLAGLGAVAFLPEEASLVEAGVVIDVELWSPL